MHYLEVFDGGLGDAAVEVEHIGLRVLVPHGRLVVQLDQVVQGVTVPAAQDALLLLSRRKQPPQLHPALSAHGAPGARTPTHVLRPDGDPFEIHVHARDDDSHLTGSVEAQHVGFLPNSRQSECVCV